MVDFLKAHFLDCSAIVKLLLYPDIVEDGSKTLFEYRQRNCLFYTNRLCLSEAFMVLKQKHFASKSKKVLSLDGYLIVINRLKSMLEHETLRITGFDSLANNNLERAYTIVKRYKIDLFDALQIVEVKYGEDSSFTNESQTILITADTDLAKAARSEGVKVWNCIDEQSPI